MRPQEGLYRCTMSVRSHLEYGVLVNKICEIAPHNADVVDRGPRSRPRLWSISPNSLCGIENVPENAEQSPSNRRRHNFGPDNLGEDTPTPAEHSRIPAEIAENSEESI